MPKLIYIGGYGHSGSTLLEYLLTGCVDLVACGEVAAVTTLSNAASHKCSCNRLARACPVWCFLADSAQGVASFDHETLIARLMEQVTDRYAGIIDSSKTASRLASGPFNLQRVHGNLHLLHIVRDPRAVCWSLVKKSRRKQAGWNDTLLSIKTALGWFYANSACELFRRKYPEQYTRVLYEDLAADPCVVVPAVLDRVLPGARWSSDAIGVADNRHQLHGNRMRWKPLKVDEIRVDNEWESAMPVSLRRLVASISWPLRARYGYS